MKRQASVQDITWFLDLDRIGRLDLNPPYQRRSVWTLNDRRFFLDTIFRNYPCPPVFIYKTIDDSGIATYHIVDGKQRLETILLFSKNKLSLAKEFGDERLDGRKFKDLESESKKVFWNYNVPVDFIELQEGIDINEIFDRVNRNSRNLERQELRHARYVGWFVQESEKEADEEMFFEIIKVTTKARSRRMRNVQFVSELLLVIIDEKMVGFDQDYLDQRYAELDSLEEIPDFDVEIYSERKNRLKDYILKMETHNNCISQYSKTAYNLYTLWSLLALESIPFSPEEMASKYSEFMNYVDKFKSVDDPDDFKVEDNNPIHTFTAEYFENCRGANTDLHQRRNRLSALYSALTMK